MRIVSHTCSNTEIVCALGAGDALVAVDADSDHPADVVAALPKLGRDLELDIDAVAALRPDLVLSSLTVPGHERIVEALRALGVPMYVADPTSLAGVYADIRAIGARIGRRAEAEALVRRMDAAMPPRRRSQRPRILVEWWPKPVIVPAGRSWVTDLIARAGGENPYADIGEKSVSLEAGAVPAVDAVVMSWCGVREANYRAEIVCRRPGWSAVPAVAAGRVVPISEAWLGRPGPRLVEGYRALAALVDRCPPPAG